MPSQYIKVVYANKRDVYVDGDRSGETNKNIKVGEGTHTIHMGDPRNYTPKFRKPTVVDTTPIKPMKVSFEKA